MPALAADARRRELQGEADGLRAERNTASKSIGETIKAGAKPDGPEVAALRARSTEIGARLDAHRGRAGDGRGPGRGPPAPHPEPRRGGRAGRGRGGERHRPRLGRPAPAQGLPRGPRRVPRRRSRPGDVGPQAALGDRRGARHPGPAARREDHRLRLPGLQGRRRGAPARPDHVVPRRPHPRERLHRDLAADAGQPGLGARHGPDPGQGRPDVRRHSRRPVPGPDRRGAGHQPAPRRDPRARDPADPLRRLHAVLPPRGRRGRQGHPRHPARPPVRQGRDGPVRATGGLAARRSSG